jgi:hypothetical protein
MLKHKKKWTWMMDHMFVKRSSKVSEVSRQQLRSGSAPDVLHTSTEIMTIEAEN